ncbi:fluoride efflux transporter FluC [Microbacterium sp. NPDC055910]|uniref:fluoride efflux transporter FluC n=1 Tax=Microbacterium sp. NPDC055910 TaxID=3345659 RepID=UPI0035E2C652
MTPGLFLLVAVGGGLGAALRFVVDGLVMRRASGRFPWGILVVNTSGSLLLGLATGLADSSVLAAPWLFVLGAGVLGGYTTFSTAMLDTVVLLQRRAARGAVLNAVGMLAITGTAAFVGLVLGRSV